MQGLSVKAAAKLSGLSAHTLRAWERRYSVVEPIRSDNGRRLYSMADVEKLKLLALLTTLGHAIGQLAEMTRTELENLALRVPPSTPSESKDHLSSFNSEIGSDTLKSLLEALGNFDLESIDRQILKARIHLRTSTFISEIVSPLLHQVGLLVVRHKLDIAQEHALSAVLRTHLGELLSQVQKTFDWASDEDQGLPRLLFTTPEGDLHEFGILIAAILAGSHGFKFIYLGPNMPAESLANAAHAFGVNIIVLGSVTAPSERLAQPLKTYVENLSKSLSLKKDATDVSIWIGGHCDFDIHALKTKCTIEHTHSLPEFEARLEKFKNAPKKARKLR